MDKLRYRTFNNYFREKFGCRVQKISVDAGFTCPNRDGTIDKKGCIFCDDNASRAPYCNPLLSISEQIKIGKELVRKKYKATKFLVYFQPFSNTYGPLELISKKYKEALQAEDIAGLSIGTRPDCVNDELLDLLRKYSINNEIWIEYGLQSIHEKSLKWLRRGHDSNIFRHAVSKTKSRNLAICVHIIIGLPDESKEEVLETVRELVRLKIDAVKIHLLHILRGTDLEKEYIKKSFKLISFNEYISIVCDVIEILPKDVIIQRLTSEAPKENLIAPDWTNQKQRIITAINEELVKRDSWQGKKCNE